MAGSAAPSSALDALLSSPSFPPFASFTAYAATCTSAVDAANAFTAAARAAAQDLQRRVDCLSDLQIYVGLRLRYARADGDAAASEAWDACSNAISTFAPVYTALLARTSLDDLVSRVHSLFRSLSLPFSADSLALLPLTFNAPRLRMPLVDLFLETIKSLRAAGLDDSDVPLELAEVTSRAAAETGGWTVATWRLAADRRVAALQARGRRRDASDGDDDDERALLAQSSLFDAQLESRHPSLDPEADAGPNNDSSVAHPSPPARFPTPPPLASPLALGRRSACASSSTSQSSVAPSRLPPAVHNKRRGAAGAAVPQRRSKRRKADPPPEFDKAHPSGAEGGEEEERSASSSLAGDGQVGQAEAGLDGADPDDDSLVRQRLLLLTTILSPGGSALLDCSRSDDLGDYLPLPALHDARVNRYAHVAEGVGLPRAVGRLLAGLCLPSALKMPAVPDDPAGFADERDAATERLRRATAPPCSPPSSGSPQG